MKANSPTIRRARVEDCQPIYDFVCDLEECDFDRKTFEQIYSLNIANPENIYLVAEVDGRISGYISCHGQFLLHHGGQVFEIQELYILPEFRNRGIGQLLVQKLEATLSQFDYQSLEVTAHKKRTKTHDFYTKMGFQVTHLKFTKEKSKNS